MTDWVVSLHTWSLALNSVLINKVLRGLWTVVKACVVAVSSMALQTTGHSWEVKQGHRKGSVGI